LQRRVHVTSLQTRWIVVFILVATALAAFAGAAGMRHAAAQTIQTRVQVLHAATDLGKVEVRFNGIKALDDFEYGNQSDWINIDPGTVQVTIARDRVGINYSVFNAVYPVPAGNDYYLAITDALVMGGTFDRGPLEGDNARIQITPASVDTPAVDVVATGADISLAGQLAYARTSDAVEVPAGTYDLEVRLSGTGEVLLSIPGGAVEAGKVYQYVLVGTPGDDDTPLEFKVLVTDTVQRASATPEA
jgi:hypothetical protein